jgi:hypothetical protein
VALTKEHAKSILWPTLLKLDQKYDLGMAFNALDLSATMPNGYRVLLRAAKDQAQIEKLLNFNKYKNSHFVYGIMYFYENDNSPERAKIVKDMNLPEEVANYRIQRVELHR